MANPTEQLTKQLQIAKYFIYKSQQEKKDDLTNKKLQKLLYYAQAWNLVFNKKALFDEPIEAWIHGPTIPSVYHYYKGNGYTAIKESPVDPETLNQISGAERQVLDAVWKIYGEKYDANYLEVLTHSEAPWQRARQNLSPLESSTNVISLENMQEYYSLLLEGAK